MRTLALALAALLVSASRGLCCRGPFHPFEENLSRATGVFQGKIVAVSKPGGGPAKMDDLIEIRFQVERWWKGGEGKFATVVTDASTCGFAPGGYREVGERWLILGGLKDGKIGTSALSGNVWLTFPDGRSAENAVPKLLLKKLGKGRPPK